MEPTDIKSQSLEELKKTVEALGEKPFRAKQLYEWMHVKLAKSFEEMTNLSMTFRGKLKESCILTTLTALDVQTSKIDGTQKYLFALHDGNVVESVLMRYKHGNSVCISSQVGCKMGCRFCASTIGGWTRNLTPAEMLEQVYRIQETSGERVSNVVVMGTGEPLDNYDTLLRFIHMISDENGLHISQRNITVSTCGLVPKMEALAERCGFPKDTVSDGINWAYMGMDIHIEDMLPVAALLLVILVSGYLIIYNIFYINVFHDIRRYGLLKTIGTTGRQLRKIVRRQAYMLCLYGIPLGLLLGGVTGKWILPIVMQNLVFSSTADTKVTLKLWIFAASAVFSLLTVYISCIKPCRIASSVSPVEAVRYTEGQNSKAAGKKGRKTKKVKPWTMAAANMQRNKKKVVIVTTSLSLGLVLLNSVYGLVSGFDMDKFIASATVSDYSVYEAGLDNPTIIDKPVEGVTREFLDALSEQSGVEEISNVYMNYINQPNFTEEERSAFNKKILQNPKAQPYLGKYFAEEAYQESIANGTFDIIDGKIFGIGRLIYEKMELSEGELDWEKFKTGKYVITSKFGHLGPDENRINYYEVGDKVTVRLDDGSSREYEVMAVGDLPYACGLQSYGVFEYNFVLPDREYLDFIGDRLPMRTLFNVEKDKEADMEKWLSNYCENVNADLDYTSKATVAAEFEEDKDMYVIVGGLLSLILAAIGILNFINTMVTSVLSRKQEFAMMEAVGMTGTQLRRMLGCEGLLYALFTGAASVILGGILNATAIRGLGNAIFFYSWRFTVTPILLCLPVLVLVVLAVPALCYRSMCRTSVTERMRKAE